MSEDTEQTIDGRPDSVPEVWIAGTKLDGGGYQVKVDGFYSGRNTAEGGADTDAHQPASMGDDTAGETAGGAARKDGLLGSDTTGDGAPNSGGNGVLATSYHNENGRFRLGNPGGGRPARDKALLIALNNRYPPEQIISMVDEAWLIASRPGRESWRGMLDVARFLTEYIIGKPVARSITVSSKAESMIERLERIQLGGEETE